MRTSLISPASTQHHGKKRKACRRCRTRKQQCDLKEPACGKCSSAGVDCVPVEKIAYERVPVGYVRSLEQHAASIERLVSDQIPGLTTDHLHHVIDEQPQYGQSTRAASDIVDLMQWINPQTPQLAIPEMNIEHPDLQQHPTFPGLHLTSSSDFEPSPRVPRDGRQLLDVDVVPIPIGASYFCTYFDFIHPQYPFLNLQECGNWYVQWKTAPSTISGWPAYFIKMIFAIGSLIQSKPETESRFQHQDLKSQAQAEQAILTDSKSISIIRMQAMLISAMYALHSDSTWRIAHISGVIMKLASMHDFHKLVDNGHEQDNEAIKVWSCAYILDRAANRVLDTPHSLPDMYITSPLYEYYPENTYDLPWIPDCPPGSFTHVYPNLSTFAHVCRLRRLQSKVMHTWQLNDFQDNGNNLIDWQESVLNEVNLWADPNDILVHSLTDTKGYQSPLWLVHMSHLTRLMITQPTKSSINSRMTDVALQASCDACVSFRAIQKKKQIAQPWLVVLSQFWAGVTLCYITWARRIKVSTEVDSASRDCAAVLTIFADRWGNAEQYRDCFDCLTRAISRSPVPGRLEESARSDIWKLAGRVIESGVGRTTRRMLKEICSGDNNMQQDGNINA